MLNERSTVTDFLKRHNMLADDIDFMNCVDMFVSEMESGLSSQSSLPMLPTYLSLDSSMIKNDKVIVIDAGGTNFRVAVVAFDENGNCEISSFSKHEMPGTKGEIDADTFFREMAALVKPFIHESDKIGFCFSWALEMTEDKDGRLLFFSKEIKVAGAEGKLIGEGLLKALGTPDKRIVMLNDTVAALLAGVANYPNRKFSSYIGFILGTGTNTAYIETKSNIKKNSEISSKPGNMIVNMESGCYGKIPGGNIDEVLNNTTKNPGSYRFEKMISGAYMGPILFYTLKAAAEEGLFSNEFTQAIVNCHGLNGAEIDDFFEYPYNDGTIQKLCKNETDCLLVYYFAEYMIERAAKLAATNLAAVVKKSGAGRNPLEPVCIIAEGTTFYKSKFLKERIQYYLKRYMTDKMGLYAEIKQVDNATIIGSAIAAIIG